MTARLALCLAVFLATFPGAATATTITVGRGGGYDYETIQAGIDAATSGDTVLVHPGTYVENIRFKGKNIVLRSTDPTDTATVAATIIDGNAIDSVVTFAGTELPTCVLTGFTITTGNTAVLGVYMDTAAMQQYGTTSSNTIRRYSRTIA